MEATGVVSPDGVTIEVSQRDVLELADAWIALERQGILDVRGFAHDLMLEAALRLLPQPIKRVIHRRVADYIAPRAAPPARVAGVQGRVLAKIEATAVLIKSPLFRVAGTSDRTKTGATPTPTHAPTLP